MPNALATKREELAAKQKSLAELFQEATGEDGKLELKKVKSVEGGPEAVAAEIKRRNDELTALGSEVELLNAQDRVEQLGKALNDPATPFPGMPIPGGQPQAKSLGEMFIESDSYKARKSQAGLETSLDVDPKAWIAGHGVKTTMTTAAGFAPQAIRSGDVVPIATRPIQVIDLIPALDTSQANVVYMEETTLTNSAAETAENAAYPESALAFTERTSNVRKIAHFLPVTDEQLEDVPFIQGYVNDRLVFMVRQRLDGQVMVGDGNAPNLKGLKNVSGIQTQAKGADPTPDAVYKAIVKVYLTGRAVADLVVMHPTDWQNLRLLRTAEGIYVWGPPSDQGLPRIWGLPIAQSDADSAGTGYVGAFQEYSYLAYRSGMDVQVGFINDDFKLGKKSIRASIRAAFVVRRPAAFATVTGL